MKEVRTIILNENDLKELISEKYGCSKFDVQIKIENDGYEDEVLVTIQK